MPIMSIQLSLVCQAATASTRQAAFPADDPLDAAGRAAAAAVRMRRVDAAWTSPARAARETAAAFGLAAHEAAALAEIDYGAWAGRGMDEVGRADPAGFAAWLADPSATPHGGESIQSTVARVAQWMASLEADGAERVVAVTHASVVRAAIVVSLGAPLSAFWRVDVAPLARASLRRRGSTWTLRSLGRDD